MANGKGTRVVVAAILFATLAVKATVLAQLHAHPLLQPHGELDSTYYIELAQKIAGGGPLAMTEPFFVSPLYVFFLAAVFRAGGSLLAAKIVQILLGTVAVALVYLTTRRWFEETSAIVAAALAACTGLFTFYEVLILQAALDPFLVACALYLLTRALTEDRARLFLAAGVALGLFVLNRPNALAYAVVAAALVGVTGGRKPTPRAGVLRAAMLAGGVLLILLPNALRNYAASGELVWISSHGGLNFYIGNHAEADGTYSLVPGINPSIAGQARDAKRVAEGAEGRTLSTDDVSRYFYRRAWDWIVEQPSAAARLLGWKLLVLLNRTNVPLNYSYAYYVQEEPTLLRFLIIGPWLLLPLGLVGLCVGVTAGGRNKVRPTGAELRAFWVWASFVPVYGLSVAAFFVSSRYRMPLLVPLCVTTGGLLVCLLNRLRAQGPAALVVPAIAIVATGTLCNWNLTLDDGVGGEQTRKAVWLIESGRSEEARQYVDASAPRHPTPGVLRFRVARALAKAGRVDDAIQVFRQALAIDHQPAIQLELGQALVASGRSAEAVPHLTAALGADFKPEQAGPWLVRALALSGQGAAAVKILTSLPDDVAARREETALDLGAMALELEAPAQTERWLRIAVARTPGRAEAHETLGVALLFLGRAREAIAPLETAVRLDASSPSAHLNLAVVYAQNGRLVDARREAEASLRLDPNEPRTRELISALRPEL
jgi:4-amino-4-deoxy-L-arabinose transferase-like glycosyltransferase/cytochrome c-type biogenesis protein CcmH/NrfG